MKHRKLLFYIIFFVVLLGGFYYFVFRDYNFDKSRLAVINASIPEFEFVDQDGRPFNTRNAENKVYVAEYFFTTCKGICPKMNTNMRRVYDTYKQEKAFMIVSHTCMPETDSVPVLKDYEKKMLTGKLVRKEDGSYKLTAGDESSEYENTNWKFVTGPKDQLYKLARQGYRIDNGSPDTTQLISEQFIHTQFFSLVDRNGRVRGIYDGLKENEVQAMISDIRDLLKEKVTTTRFMNGFSNSPN